MFAKLILSLGVFIATTLPALAFGTCTDSAYLAAFDITDPVTRCDVREDYVIHLNGDPVNIRFINLNGDAHGSDDAWIGYIEGVLDRVAARAASMGPMVHLSDITILLSSREGTYGGVVAHGVTFTNSLPDECPIIIHKTTSDIPAETFGDTLAHEIFHCIQDVTWSDQMDAPASKWWVEGSAEYFGSWVVSESDSSSGVIAAFSPDSQTNQIYSHAMDYQNVVFFDWLHQQSGPTGVADFLQAMPASGDYLAALQGVLPMDRWASFVEDYLKAQVLDTAARTINPSANRERVTADQETGDFARQTDAYLLHRIGIIFPADANYNISTDAGPNVRSRMLIDHEWTELPVEISTCDGEKRATVYSLTTTGPEAVTIHYDRSPCSACQRVVSGDACLIGTWTMTGGGPIEWMRAQGMERHIRAQATDMTVRMFRNGKYLLNPVTAEVEADNDGTPVTGIGQSDGLGGTWGASDGVLHVCPRSGEVSATVQIGGQASRPMLFGPGDDMDMAYTCHGNTLTTTLEIRHLPPMETTYTKTGR